MPVLCPHASRGHPPAREHQAVHRGVLHMDGIGDAGLAIMQAKSTNKVLMEITGELATLLDRIAKRKSEKLPNGRSRHTART